MAKFPTKSSKLPKEKIKSWDSKAPHFRTFPHTSKKLRPPRKSLARRKKEQRRSMTVTTTWYEGLELERKQYRIVFLVFDNRSDAEGSSQKHAGFESF